MLACEAYASYGIAEALVAYDVGEYREELAKKVNAICLEMGFNCRNDKAKFQRLAEDLKDIIYSISSDKQVREKLFNYANRVVIIGRNFLTSGIRE